MRAPILAKLSEAAVEFRFEFCAVQILPDEHELALPLLILFPQAIPQQREAIVYPVKYRAARIACQAQEALASVDLLLLRHLLDEVLQFLDDERFVVGERERI